MDKLNTFEKKMEKVTYEELKRNHYELDQNVESVVQKIRVNKRR